MRLGARLASSKFTLLSRTSSASRTADGEYLFWAEFPLHRKPPSKKGGQLNQFWEAHLDGLRPPDNRHGPILQKQDGDYRLLSTRRGHRELHRAALNVEQRIGVVPLRKNDLVISVVPNSHPSTEFLAENCGTEAESSFRHLSLWREQSALIIALPMEKEAKSYGSGIWLGWSK